jgi:hypothetical protein
MRAQNEALAALQERNWHGVELLRAGEVAERPAQEPHGTAWLEASEGRRGIIVYQEAGPATKGRAKPEATPCRGTPSTGVPVDTARYLRFQNR